MKLSLDNIIFYSFSFSIADYCKMQTDETLAQLTEMFGDYIDQTRIDTAVLCNKDCEYFETLHK